MKRTSLALIAGTRLGLLVVLSGTTRAADWPQYRGDAARTSYTAEELPRALKLDWVRQPRHQPHRAWVGRFLSPSRMKFDWCYAPVVSGNTLFFGSSADHQVHALDAETGEEKWRFFTGGPVRLAPAVWKGRVLAVSDDGYLYCLDASAGALRWKLRAGPSDELMLGNGRMVSRWAARGGPAVRDGIVYFAAGPWPVEGVYVYAVDIATGRTVWCNDSSGALETEHPHMGSVGQGGAVSQGYLAISADKVYVSTGRATPAVYDRKTGRLQHFHLSRYGGKTPWGIGGGDTVVTDDLYFNGGYVFDAATGLRYSVLGRDNRWTPYVFHNHKYHGQFVDGPGRDVALTPAGPLFYLGSQLHGGKLGRKTYDARREAQVLKYAKQLAFASEPKPARKGASEKYHLERIDNAPTVKTAWNADMGVAATALIVAGPVAYIGAKERIVGLNISTKKVDWSANVAGTVRALAAANGRLYAATDKGAIYAFAKDGRGSVVQPRGKHSPYPKDGPLARRAAAILQKTGIMRGYCLDIDRGDPSASSGEAGELAYQLAIQGDLYMVAIAANSGERDAARRKLDAAGLYGTRVVVLGGPPSERCLPPYFANLVISRSPLAEHLRPHLSPYRGALCTVDKGKIGYRSPTPPRGAGTWTHGLGDSGNSLCSGDELVGGPLGILWYTDEDLLTIDRHGKNPAPLFADGIMVRAGFDGIKTIDAYNGTLLWKREIPGLLRDYQGGTGVGAVAMGGMCCIESGAVFVRHDNYCLALDLLTGKQLAKHTAPPHPDGKPGTWGYLAADRGVLFGTLFNEHHVVRGQHGDGGERVQVPMGRHFTESILLFALDAKTGKLKWHCKAKDSIRNNSIAVGNGRAYFIDRPVAEIDRLLKADVAEALRRGGTLPEHATGLLICRDARTGRELWRDEEDVFGTTLGLSKTHDLLVMSYNKVGRAIPSDSQGHRTRCYHAASGERAWDSPRMGARPILNDRTLYSYPNAYDLFTGKRCTLVPGAKLGGPGRADAIRGKGIGCGTPIGSRHMLFIRSGAIGYYDIEHDAGWLETYGGIRSGCWLNAIPVGGIVLVPDDTRACRCSFPNQASIALCERGVRPPRVRPAGGQKNWRYTQRLSRLEMDFTGKLLIEILPPDDRRYELRYTLDGNVPDARSPLYTEPLSITQTTTVNAAAFRDGARQSLRLGVHCARLEP